MAKQRKPENTQSYTYESADGSRNTICAGEEGVTEELIQFLRESDSQMALQERNQRMHTSYAFQNAMERYALSPDAERLNPLEQIPDPSADIMRMLFPEEGEDPWLAEKVREAMEQLTEQQRELIDALYYSRRKVTEIALEQHVTREAIQNRRNKIFRRIRKLMEAETD